VGAVFAAIAFWRKSSGVDDRGAPRRSDTIGAYHYRLEGRQNRATRPSAVSTRSLAALAVGAALCGACGRRATPADCQLIVDKSVELQMKAMSETDPAVIRDREAHIRGELQDELKQCETRRVTDKTMACVSTATSSTELDKCLH
jgi:hypothetical protein